MCKDTLLTKHIAQNTDTQAYLGRFPIEFAFAFLKPLDKELEIHEIQTTFVNEFLKCANIIPQNTNIYKDI